MPRASANGGICDYADRLIDDLADRVAASFKKQDAKATHDARVAARRVRAVLDLLVPLVPDRLARPLRKTAQKVRRRLGPVRDLDVMLDQASELARQQKMSAASAAWLTHRLDIAHAAAVRKLRKKRSLRERLDELPAQWQEMRQRLAGRECEMRELIVASLRTQCTDFAERADRLAGHALAGVPADAVSPDPHELRIAAKELRYTLEMLPGLGLRLSTAAMRTFKRMQSELGQWHDRVVLSERAVAESLDAELSHHDPALQAQVLALAADVLRRAQSHLRKFAKLWQASGEALSHTIAQLSPAAETDAAAVTPRQTDRDPAGLSSSQAPEELPPDAQTAA